MTGTASCRRRWDRSSGPCPGPTEEENDEHVWWLEENPCVDRGRGPGDRRVQPERDAVAQCCHRAERERRGTRRVDGGEPLCGGERLWRCADHPEHLGRVPGDGRGLQEGRRGLHQAPSE